MISYNFPVGPVHLLPCIMVLFITICYIASSCHLLQTSSMVINGCLFPFITWANLWMVTFQCFSHCYLIAKLLALAPSQRLWHILVYLVALVALALSYCLCIELQ